ncbi:MAG: hypothetical protein ACRDOK_01525 [Streptosporangiaceae bacterium]
MTAGAPVWPVRLAAYQGTCGRPGCTVPIYAGTEITKPPGRPWQHSACPVSDRQAQRQRHREEQL